MNSRRIQLVFTTVKRPSPAAHVGTRARVAPVARALDQRSGHGLVLLGARARPVADARAEAARHVAPVTRAHVERKGTCRIPLNAAPLPDEGGQQGARPGDARVTHPGVQLDRARDLPLRSASTAASKHPFTVPPGHCSSLFAKAAVAFWSRVADPACFSELFATAAVVFWSCATEPACFSEHPTTASSASTQTLFMDSPCDQCLALYPTSGLRCATALAFAVTAPPGDCSDRLERRFSGSRLRALGEGAAFAGRWRYQSDI